MKTKQVLVWVVIGLLALFLVACGGSDEPEAEIPPTAVSEPEASESTEETEEAANEEGGTTADRTFVVVPEESTASFVMDEEFLAEAFSKLGIEAGQTVVVGTTSGVSGDIQIDLTSAEPVSSAQFTVNMTGLQTDQDRRDNWLEDNAIETSKFPEATFTATSVTGLPDSIDEGEAISFQLNGDLTVRDVTNSVTFEVTAVLEGDTVQGTAVLPLKLTDFDIEPPDFANTLKVADEFKIEVTLTAREN